MLHLPAAFDVLRLGVRCNVYRPFPLFTWGAGDKFCLHCDIGKIFVVVVFLILLFDLFNFYCYRDFNVGYVERIWRGSRTGSRTGSRVGVLSQPVTDATIPVSTPVVAGTAVFCHSLSRMPRYLFRRL